MYAGSCTVSAEEDKVRALERQLQVARNEVKRYASRALQAQQDLERERRRAEAQDESAADESVEVESGRSLYERADDDSDSSGDERTTDWPSERVERAMRALDEWAREIARLTKTGKGDTNHRRNCKTTGASDQTGEGGDRGDADADAQPETVPDQQKRGSQRGNGLDMLALKALVRDQRLCVTELSRENARLREMVRSRPTRRELLDHRLEIERLQAQLRRRRGCRDAVTADASPDDSPKLFLQADDCAAGASRSALSDRIVDDKLLRLLYVQVESVASPDRASSQPRGRAAADASLHRRSFLQEDVHCRLSLDPSALSSVASTENSRGSAERLADISRRVGRVSSEIVASCCFALGVEDVAKLPRHVEALQRRAQAAPVYQAFADKLAQQLERFDQMLKKVVDVLVELDARRQQMKPPGSKAHDVLFESMRLLRVTHIDKIIPSIRRMIVSIQAERAFEQELREVIGLDDSATRKETLTLVSKFFRELGIGLR